MNDIFQTINTNIKNRINIFLNTILPSKIPEFSVNDVENPIFFVYFSRDKIIFISHLSDKPADEIIKVGIVDDEFIFYPLKKDSKFFEKEFELKTFKFIELILSSNLTAISEKIYENIKLVGSKIVEYKTFYISRLKNLPLNIDIIDETKILEINNTLNKSFNDALKEELNKISQVNILDSMTNIFSIIYPEGLYDIDSLTNRKNAADTKIISNYYNKSNLSNPEVLQSLIINLSGKEFKFKYFIDSFFLQYSVSKKILAKAQIRIKNIDIKNLQPSSIIYSNNELKSVITNENIVICNRTNNIITLYNLNSIFTTDNTNPYEINIDNVNLKILPNDEVSIVLKKDNPVFIENISEDFIQNSKIKHNIKLTYSMQGDKKSLIGNSQHKIISIFNNIV